MSSVRVVGPKMQAVPNPFSPGGLIQLSVTLIDTAAPPGSKSTRVLRLNLHPSSGLTFAGGTTFVDRTRMLGADPTPVTFDERIGGNTTGFGFNIGLFDAGDLVDSVDVTVV